MFQSPTTIMLAVLLLAAIVFVVVFIRKKCVEKEERRLLEQAYERDVAQAIHGPYTWDPALCEHSWVKIDDGECLSDYGWNGYQSVPTALGSYSTYSCIKCGAHAYTCTHMSVDKPKLTCGEQTCAGCDLMPTCPAELNVEQPEDGEITRTFANRVVDAKGFEYNQYRLRDSHGNERIGYCPIVPTTYLFTCPDCGNTVTGVDAARVRPGGIGPNPTAYRCEGCGRQEAYDFGVPRVEDCESPLTFDEPRGMEMACSEGGRHSWEVVDEWETVDFPPGVDACTENLCFLEQEVHHRLRCVKCGKERDE